MSSSKQSSIDDLPVPNSHTNKTVELGIKSMTHAFQVVSNLADYGNTSAASIPLVLDERVRDGTIKSGDVVIIRPFVLWEFCTHFVTFCFQALRR